MAHDIVFEFAKEKMLKVWDGYTRFEFIAKPLYFLYIHMPPAKFLASLDWLIAQRLCGQRFIDFYMLDCRHSDLELQRVLLSKVEKVSKERLFAGKDVVV